MTKIFILEDCQERIEQFKKNFTNVDITFSEESKDAIKILEKQEPFDYIFLDHDLGGQEMVKSGKGTGYEVAQWLAENADKKPKFQLYTHTLNPAGRSNILGVLGYGLFAPFVWVQKIKF